MGNLVPYADNLLNFEIDGEATIAGVDNGKPRQP
jgi:beta-galactosidase